jgi:photosystem II stability/assembly factor-like uncharacterized protein
MDKDAGDSVTNRRTHLILQDPVDEKILLYAGTTQGLWKSQDGGLTWLEINPYPYVINYMTIDPRDHNVIFLTTDRSGILKTTDGGLRFHAMNEGFINRNISRFVAGDILYASSLYDGDFGGIFSSRDQGKSWNLNASQAALQGRNVISMAISPNNPKLLFAGIRGLLQSEDAGKTWRSTTGEITPVAPRAPSRQGTLNKHYVKPTPVRYVRLPAAKIYEVTFSKSSLRGSMQPPQKVCLRVRMKGNIGNRLTDRKQECCLQSAFHPTDPQWIAALSQWHPVVSGSRKD